MAARRKKKDQEPGADHGGAYEPLAGEIVNTDFPPEETPGPQAVVQSVADATRLPPDQGRGQKEWVRSLTVITDPEASSTARLTKFSEAISSRPSVWRFVSWAIAAAISGSAWARECCINRS